MANTLLPDAPVRAKPVASQPLTEKTPMVLDQDKAAYEKQLKREDLQRQINCSEQPGSPSCPPARKMESEPCQRNPGSCTNKVF
ncbi:hypothetical protein [Chromobacterium alticapitis]|uniref:hypothetical protein n=1 Tax=Chromobacterium alticapitis TaxID=2073169 RepID=UPI0011B09A38|nr:hypothetical protein [Chromobacterium alticapitis]